LSAFFGHGFCGFSNARTELYHWVSRENELCDRGIDAQTAHGDAFHNHPSFQKIPLELCPKESGTVSRLTLGGTVHNLSVAAQISSLPGLHKQALTRLWLEFFETDPPSGMRKELMVQFLAYRIQEQAFGSVSERNRSRLDQLAKAIESSCTTTHQKIRIKPGTRLIREWREEVHAVNVEDEGYEYRGNRFESLSEIARLITGTRWSGPSFFGLKNKTTRDAKGAA
jgi:Protein of unknown function (DUF2924)